MQKNYKIIILGFVIYYLTLHFINSSDSLVMFDVGQGDGVLLKINGRNILIDGGPFYNLDYSLHYFIPFYNCRFDVVVITHAHFDHSSGVDRVLNRCKTSDLWFQNVYEYDVKIVDDIEIYVLWPPRDFTSKNENDNSIVLLIKYKELDFLFMGDIEETAISKLDTNYLNSIVDIPVEFYKVSHHGSINGHDPSFIAPLRPEVCLISVGRNTYGHPSDEVISSLEDIGCDMYRTDIFGDIEFKLD